MTTPASPEPTGATAPAARRTGRGPVGAGGPTAA